MQCGFTHFISKIYEPRNIALRGAREPLRSSFSRCWLGPSHVPGAILVKHNVFWSLYSSDQSQTINKWLCVKGRGRSRVKGYKEKQIRGQMQSRGLQAFPGKGQRGGILGCAGRTASGETTPLCGRSAKAATDTVGTNECGRVPIKLYLQNAAWGQMWLSGNRLSTPNTNWRTIICFIYCESFYVKENTKKKKKETTV